MEVAETLVQRAAEEAITPGVDVSWFVARQPGVVRFLESRLRSGTDVCGVAILSALAIHAAFEKAIGVPPTRVTSSLLLRSEKAVVTEAHTQITPPDGLVARQPALAAFIAEVVARPPVPLATEESVRLGLALLAVAYALDETVTGRSVP